MPAKTNEEFNPGFIFANNWQVVKKYSPAEYTKIREKLTGEKVASKLHNAYYYCRNLDCGIGTYIERTKLRNYVKQGRTILHYCKNCNPDTCYYKSQIRTHTNPETTDRTPKVKVGDSNGIFTVQHIITAAESGFPQIRLRCTCNKCGAEKILYMHHYESKNHTCDCFRGGSMGETLVNDYLKKNNIPFEREYTFADLSGKGHGKLRYDFALLKEGELIGVIEFDGQQHFQEGGLFNPEGRVQEHDTIKNQYLKDHNIPLLRIPYYEADKVDSLIDNFLKELK